MSAINISDLAPKVRDVFMLAGPAIFAWDVKSHEVLEDCIQNNKRIQSNITKRTVVDEIMRGVFLAFALDFLPIEFFYLYKEDNSTFAVKGRLFCVFFIVMATIWVAVHRKRKIMRLKLQGAEWRTNINTLIERTGTLSFEERQQLYVVMLALGIEVQQGKQNAAMIDNAYNEGWWDGFVIGGD